MSLSEPGALFIGTSGFYYSQWIGKFYPNNIPKTEWLTFYARKFSSLEINSSFYRLPKEKTLKAWYEKTPSYFKFSLKASKYITHTKKLRNVKEDVESFVKLSSLLKEKLGVLLFQLPGSLRYNPLLLENFLSVLPKNYKYSIEFRDLSWFRKETYNILKKYKVSLCNISSPKIDNIFEVTTPFIYIRFHGIKRWYNYNYRQEDLVNWVKFVKNELLKGKDVYVYFNNDASGYAIENAMYFKKLVEEE